MNGVKVERVQRIKDLSVTIASNLTFSQHCKDATGKANRTLGFINIIFSFKNKDIIPPLCIVKTHLGMQCNFWSPYLAKDILATLKAIQRRVTKMIPSLCNESYEKRLARLNLFLLEKRRLQRKLSFLNT